MSEAGTVYQRLKIARQLFSKSLEALAPDERAKVDSVAVRQCELEALILGAPEAASVMLPASTVEANLMDIRARYPDEDGYQADLQRIGLDEAGLRAAVERDMRVEAVLEKIGARAAAVSDTDVEIFWFMHKDRFRRPETRVLRHILITVNETLAGNDRASAKEKIDAIRARLLKSPERFEEQALKHSECPTAMNGGLLGTAPRGQLYPELEAAAFALPEGGLSEVVESELGFHVLRCDAINAERTLSLAEARQKIRDHLEGQRRGICQKSWINALRRKATADAA